jgi:mRNA interferase YafQ
MKIALFEKVAIILEKNGALPTAYKPHLLHGDYSGLMECHISPDWLLIFRVKSEEKEIDLIRMGSHSDLF